MSKHISHRLYPPPKISNPPLLMQEQPPFNQTPELLAPAGGLEKLKIACLYGADAVYIGGQKYGLRSGADNFTNSEIEEGCQYAHEHGVKVYVVMNAFLHLQDFDGIAEFLGFLGEVGVDGIIVSDAGVLSHIRKHSNIPAHLSTQASCLNTQAAKLWKELGVTRIVTGRELSIYQAAFIGQEAQVEIETFVHGAMCSSYSGNCTISNYTAGRDSNRGGCKQSCRFEYQVPGLGKEQTFMSSKDLLGLRQIPLYIEQGIHSLKIEGRMKSNMYVASTCKAYRTAINEFSKEVPDQKVIDRCESELNLFSNRGYTEADLSGRPLFDSISQQEENPNKFNYMGTVIHHQNNQAWVQLKNPLKAGDQIQYISRSGPNKSIDPSKLFNFSHAPIQSARQDQVIKIEDAHELFTGMVLYKGDT
ncbi:MAG: U32 family peptidase C-terminal domain-containing protein [Planctomycetes bacterium]|nr:U32 family peptidase C-terminal domain-containing protein [Planctomycetota bacterium]